MKTVRQAYREQIALNNMMVAGWSKSATGKISADLMVPKGAIESMGTLRTRMGYAVEVSKQLSTQFLNMGKNIQWAGRQLTVGFSYPIAIAGGAMAKFAFDIDKGITQVIKVYDTGANGIKDSNEKIRADAEATTKAMAATYGQSATDTLDIMSTLASAGRTGVDLQKQTAAVSRAALLGDLDRNDALKTTITLQSAYNLSTKQLADTWNFFNSVENSTVLTMQDISEALPRVSGIMNTLGVSVQDTVTMLTAFKSAGIDAVEGATALKSISFKIFNPNQKAKDSFLALTGIDYQQIIKEGKGQLIPTLEAISKATKGLSNIQMTQIIGNLAGIHQGSRFAGLIKQLGTISDKTTQVGRAADVAKQSTTDWAKTANGEMETLRASVSNRLLRAWQTLKVEMAEVGKTVLAAITPMAEAIAKVVGWFNGLGDTTKRVTLIGLGVAALIGPITMFTGLFLNMAATIAKAGLSIAGLVFKFEILEPKTKAARILSDLMTDSSKREANARTLLTEAIEKQTASLAAFVETQNLAAGMGGKPGVGGVGTAAPAAAQARAMATPAVVQYPTRAAKREAQQVADAAARAEKSWGKIARNSASFAMAASMGVSMFSSGNLANIANAVFMVSAFGPLLTKLPIVDRWMGSIASGASGAGKAIGEIGGKYTPKAMTALKGLGSFMVGPWGLAIGAALGGVWLWHKKINDQIEKSTAEYLTASNSSKAWADALGVTYRELQRAKPRPGEDNSIGEQMAAIEKMKQDAPELVRELQGLYNASDAEKWSRALQEGYDVFLHTGSEKAAKKATRTALRIMGLTFDSKEFNVRINAKLDLTSWQQNADRNVTLMQNILNNAAKGKFDNEAGSGEKVWRAIFGGGAGTTGAAKAHIKRQVDNIFKQLETASSDAQRTRQLLNIGNHIGGTVTKAYSKAVKDGLIKSGDDIGEFLKSPDYYAARRQTGLHQPEVDAYLEFIKEMKSRSGIPEDADIYTIRDLMGELGLLPKKAQKAWDDFEKSFRHTKMSGSASIVGGPMQGVATLVKDPFPNEQNSIDSIVDSRKQANAAAQNGIDLENTQQSLMERSVEYQKQSRVQQQNTVDVQNRVTDAVRKTVKMTADLAKQYGQVARNAAETVQGITFDYFSDQYQQALDKQDEARSEREQAAADALSDHYNNLNDKLDARTDRRNAQIDNAEKKASARLDAKESRLNAAIDKAEERSNAQFDARSERIDAQFEKQKDAIDARRSREDKAFEARWEAIDDRLEKRQKARRDSIAASYDRRVAGIQKTIDAEKRAEDIRQQIFEAEKTRISRMAQMFGQNVDFNQQIQSGNFDEAAKIANDMQSQQQQWGVDDTSKESQSSSDKLIERYQKEIDAINKSKDARLEQLDDVDKAEKKALDNRKEREQEEIAARRKTEDKKFEATQKAAKKRLDVERANAAKIFDVQRNNVKKILDKERERLQQTLKIRRDAVEREAKIERKALDDSLKRKQNAMDKENRQHADLIRTERERRQRGLDAELAAIKASVPRTERERQAQIREIKKTYAKYGVTMRGKGKDLSRDLAKYLYQYTKAGVKDIQNNVRWDAVGANIAKKLLKSGTNLTPKQFMDLVTKGVLPKKWTPNSMTPGGRTGGQFGGHGTSAIRRLTDAYHHTGGIAGESGKRVGIANSSHREVGATLLKGEGILNLNAMRKLGGKAFVKAANEGRLQANVGGPDLGGGLAGAAIAMAIPQQMAMVAKGLYEATRVKASEAMQSASGMVNATVSGGQPLTGAQIKNAQIIMGVGKGMGASNRDLIIAIMTAMQESGLRNLNYGDRDSLGLFQQRPSQGWGMPDELTDPQYAARKFFDSLLALGDERNHMSLGGAAQAVQRSAFPGLYSQWEGLARGLVGSTKFGTGVGGATGSANGSWTDLIQQIAMGGAGGMGGGPGGHMNYRQMINVAKNLGIPGVGISSSLRPNAITHSGYRSYHGLGSAIDIVAPNMMRVFDALRQRFGGIARELYYSPAGGRQVRNGHPYNTKGTPAFGDHFSHVHWAMRPPGSGNSTYADDAWRNMIMSGVGRIGDGEGDTSRGRFIKPTSGRTSSRYGSRDIGLGRTHHDGVDIAAAANSPVHAIASGVVASVKRMDKLVGNMSTILHADGSQSQYMHQSRMSVRPGDRVRQGSVIGNVGSTGLSTGAHLHMAMIRDGKYEDPSKYIPGLAVGGRTINSGIAKLHPDEMVLTKPLTAKLESGIERIDSGNNVEYNITLDMRGSQVSNDFNFKEFKRNVRRATEELQRENGPSRRIKS